MNREIKFRIVIDNKVVNFIDFSDKEGFIYSSYIADWFTSDKMKMNQFTGLKDKNDKDIYEGDIVNIIKGDNHIRCFVKYEFLGFHFEINGSLNRNEIILLDSSLEVIGNIYENPDLLK